MDVLVVNAGSTSLKLHLVTGDESRAVEGFVRADAVGHRVVHGGRRFAAAALVDAAVEQAIEELEALAPLHNARALEEIRRAREALPDVPHVAVFDTAFHRTLPEEASTYAVPARWREEWDVHRYGFHGISVQWAASQVRAERLVVCHLGGGCSVTAVREGRSVDTTMGFSPLAVGVFVHRVSAAVAAMAAACGGVDVLVFTGGIGEHADDVRERIVDRVRFLGEFRVEVVESREELVIAMETRRLLAPG